jgi:uncharacterized protein (TIGR02145 family)
MHKRVFFCFLIVFFLCGIQCGLFEPENGKGVLRIFLVKDDADDDHLEKTQESLSSVRCILKKGSSTVHDQEHSKVGSSFQIDIEELDPGDDYSILLYGRTIGGDIIGRGYREGVRVNSGEVTDVSLSWGGFRPVLNVPADGSTVTDNTPTFDWSDVSGAAEYELQADNSNSFTSPEINQSSLTISTYTPSGSLLDGIYYWRVRAKDSQGSWGSWSSMWSFTINGSIAVTSPNGGETWIVGETRNITWTSNGTSGNVKIEYSTNGGSVWNMIIASTPDNGIHPWTVSGTPSSNCYVKITDTDGSPTDQSNSAFTISSVTGTVTDIDGNMYQTIQIGNQLWMAENLKVTRYRNGDVITNVTDNTDWSNLTAGARCSYNNDENNVTTYGYLYNWYAVNDSRNIAPEGWHVPTDDEWQILVDYLGGSFVAGGKMKESGTAHWPSPNTDATNESGFTALPGGYRYRNGTSHHMGYYAYFWSATEYDTLYALYQYLIYYDSRIYRTIDDKQYGFSVRCVRD